jgi:hypothetical protein
MAVWRLTNYREVFMSIVGLLALLGVSIGVQSEFLDMPASEGGFRPADMPLGVPSRAIDLGLLLDLPGPSSEEMAEFARQARTDAGYPRGSAEGFTRILPQSTKIDISQNGIAVSSNGEEKIYHNIPIECENTAISFRVKVEGGSEFRLAMTGHKGMQEARVWFGAGGQMGSLLVNASLNEMPTIWLPPSFGGEQTVYVRIGQCNGGMISPASFALDRIVLLPMAGHLDGDACNDVSGSDWGSM